MIEQKKRIERRMRRLLGQSPEKRAAVAEALRGREFWARCWNCRKTVTGTQSELSGTCPHCGVNLRSRG